MNLFSNDSFLGKVLGMIGDTVLLNLLFILCSLPAVTAGASFCALYYVLMEKQKDPDIPVAAAFFRAFRENLKQGIPAWLIVLAAGLLLYEDCRIFSPGGLYANTMLFDLFIILAVILVLPAIWLFPVISAFRSSLKNLFIQSFFFAFKNLPWTIVLAGLWFLPIFMTFRNADYLLIGVSLWLIFGFALVAGIQSRIFYRKFLPCQNPGSSGGHSD